MKNGTTPQSEFEAEILRAFDPVAKNHGVHPIIEFRGPSRAIRSSAPFRFDKHHVVIRFEEHQAAPSLAPAAQRPAPELELPHSFAPDHLASLIRALDRAEHAPGHSFVAIKWFRDQALARGGMSRGEADEALSRAIAENLVLIAKINNPKNPAFQTTTVRLNRSDARVTRLLEAEAGPPPRRFEPINLEGVSLSEVILRDRR